MSDELVSLANEIQDLDQTEEGYEETYQTKLTNFIENNPQYNEEAHFDELTITEDITGVVTIANSEGFVLNDLLPAEYEIVFSDDGQFYHQTGEIQIPRDFEERGLHGRIGLAHEIGHALDASEWRRNAAYNAAELAAENASSADEFLEAYLKMVSLELEDEVLGWNNGKAFADILQVDELIYEDMMDNYIKYYFLGNMEQLAINMKELGLEEALQDKDKQIEMYDPFLQTNVELRIKDIVDMVNNVDFANENALNELKSARMNGL